MNQLQSEIKLDVQLNVKEFQDYNAQRARKKMFSLQLPLVILLCFMFIGFFASENRDLLTIVIFGVLLFGIFFGLTSVIVFILGFIGRWVAKQSFLSDKTHHKPFQCVISSEDIKTYNGSSYTKLNWNEIYLVEETKTIFAIFISEHKVILLPKRCFRNDTERIQLRNLLKLTLPGKKYRIFI